MDSKERLEVVGAIARDLKALPTEGEAGELVKLTSNVVNHTKRLLEGAPESVVGEGKTVLAQFVMAARAIAQNPHSAGPKALKTLTSSKQDVEVLVRRLNNWHATRSSGSERKSSMEINLEQISPSAPASPPRSPVSELEQSLVRRLQGARQELQLRKEVRRSNSLEDEPRSILKAAVVVLNTSVQEMERELGKESPGPRREPLLEPLLNMAHHVCKLLDLEDTLFVAKFPMRKQVHTFTETLLDRVLDFKMDRSAEMVREIRANLKGLLQSAEVMVSQCHQRSQNIDDSKMRSIKRIAEMKEAKEKSLQNVFSQTKEPGSVHKISVESSSGHAPGVQGNFDISCLVCTDSAVDQSTQQPITRGSELVLQCTANVTVLHIKKDLGLRTGIPALDIELCIGREPLEDGFRLINHGGTPFFLFNRNEPSTQQDGPEGVVRRKVIKDEDIDWTLYKNPISRALFDYLPTAEEQRGGSLSFYEGDIVEILVKSPDGWWEGKACGKVGVFPGSFVEEIVKSEVHARKSSMDNGIVNSAPPVRKFPTPPNPSKSKQQRASIPTSFLSNKIRKAPSEPEVNKPKDQANGAASTESKKSFSPRFAKKVSCLAAAGDGDSDSDDDRVILQRQQQQKVKKGKDRKGSFKVKFPLAADSRTQKGAASRMVPVKDDSSSLSPHHASSLVRHHLPRSPHSSLDDLSTNAVKKSAYQLAHACIDFLMLENRAATDRVFRLPGNMSVVKKYLEIVDNGQLPSTHDLPNVHTACSTLKALFRDDRITFIISEFLVQEFHTLAVKAAPVMVVKEKMQGLSEDPRRLLEKLLKLFAQILEHSRKNRTDISALSKTFGPLILENCSTKRAEVILAYLVSTCEFIF